MGPPSWSCDCCCESWNDYTSINIDESLVCVACVRKMFDKALEFEHEYPPTWAGSMHPSEFSHIFSKEYIENYKRKELEYKMPPSRRVYCQHMISHDDSGGRKITEPCGTYLGPRQRLTGPNALILARCEKCTNATCMVCDEFSSDAATMLQHVCSGKSRTNEKRAQAFAGLKRGRDWQECPNRQCGRRIELAEACNHMTCQCGTGFCFICGKTADGDSDHWEKGGCPRYNQPGDPYAEYDDHYGGDDSDSDDESDNDSYADPLENVRGLFEEDEASVTDAPANETLTGMDRLRDALAHSTSSEDDDLLDRIWAEHAALERPQPGSMSLAEAVMRTNRGLTAEWAGDDDLDQWFDIRGEHRVSMEDIDIDRMLWRLYVE